MRAPWRNSSTSHGAGLSPVSPESRVLVDFRRGAARSDPQMLLAAAATCGGDGNPCRHRADRLDATADREAGSVLGTALSPAAPWRAMRADRQRLVPDHRSAGALRGQSLESKAGPDGLQGRARRRPRNRPGERDGLLDRHGRYICRIQLSRHRDGPGQRAPRAGPRAFADFGNPDACHGLRRPFAAHPLVGLHTLSAVAARRAWGYSVLRIYGVRRDARWPGRQPAAGLL